MTESVNEVAFWAAFDKSGVVAQGMAAPENAYRLKFRRNEDMMTVARLVSTNGGRYTIRDGMANGPVLTFRFPMAK